MAKNKQTGKKKTAPKATPKKQSYSLPVLIVLIALSVLIIYLSTVQPGGSTMVGALQKVVRGLAGDMSAVLSALLLYLGVYQVIARKRGTFSAFHVFGVVMLALCVFTGAELFECPELRNTMQYYGFFNFAYSAYLLQAGGGMLGSAAWYFYNAMDVIGGFIVVVTIALVTVAMLTHAEIFAIIEWFRARKSARNARIEKRREEKELNGMFDYDDFEEPVRRQQRRPEPRPRTVSAARPVRRETGSNHPLYDMEENAEVQRVRSERRVRRAAEADVDADMIGGRETSPRPVRPAAVDLPRRSPETEEMPPVRSRRTAAPAADAAERDTSARPVRRTAAPVDAAEPETPPQPVRRFYDDEAKAPEFRPVRRTAAPATAAAAHPDAEKVQEDPFLVTRYRSNIDTPVSGDDFAGGHMRTVHGQSALKGGSVSRTIDTRPRAGMGMPPVVFDEDAAAPADEIRADEVPMNERDLTIVPDDYEDPDDEPPFDVPDAPAKQLGKFTRRAKEEPAEEEEVYNYPPLDLLAASDAAAQQDTRDQDLVKAQDLEDTLRAFGIDATLSGVAHGPAVTRFEFSVPMGVRVNKVANLADDIAYNMAATTVRIEAPIPGKKAVGVEIPNDKIEVVPLRDVLESPDAVKSTSRIAVALGKDNAGRYIMADIAKMPHVLIAGSTGSGKSVCVNSIIMSILYRARPDEVKLILVDPKVVELSVYNEIPHLIAPVVTDPQKAAAALDWAVVEMETRYKKFAAQGVRNIAGYNKHLPEGEKPMPQIVIIIDELADLMMVAPGEVESSICRLAQLARAAGMHLVVATQRPSVNVVTGLIKNNIPARIGFKVTSQVDSRTIFDAGGAEKLLGRGDMLYLRGEGGKPLRIQGTWVSDDEVQNVVDFIKDRHGNRYDEDVIEHMNRSNTPDAERDDAIDEECDDRLEEAVEIVIDAGQASISMLQRKMRVGYARAGRLIDEMCRRGIVSEADGAKPRVVLITKEQFYSAFTD